MGLSHTVSGDIASFRTPSRVPIESLKIHFLPKQEGSGDPSPTNIRPITGWTGLNGRRSGKNLLNVDGTNQYSGIEKVNGKFVNTLTDTRGQVQIYFEGYNITGNQIRLLGQFGYTGGITSPQIVSKTISVTSQFKNMTHLGIKHNGRAKDFRVYFPIKLPIGAVLNCSVEVFSVDVTTVGGFSIGNIQLEASSNASDYKPYSGEQIPITFPDGETIYGGYYDPVAGEIVAEYALASVKKSEFGSKLSPSSGGMDYRNSQFNMFPETASEVSWNTARQQQKCNMAMIANPYSETSYGNNIGVIITQASYNSTYMRISEELYQALNDTDAVEISYKLKTPIHIPLTPQDLKAFLDHNNFWSDANDITEVTYAVTESKDMLATRKKAMDFDIGHHKKVRWNQISLDGNFQDTDYRNWQWNADFGTFQIHNDIATWTANQSPSAYYATGFTRKTNYLLIPYNHKILVSAKMRTSAYYSTLQFRIYGMVNTTGGAHTYFYSDNVQAADTWQTVRGFISDRPETPPSGFDDVIIKKFKPLLCKSNHGSYEGIVDDGTTMDVKELMAFDLTQMFGLGNEPQTVAEFEHICEINGIDLTTYQPYDTGSDRWLIVP